MVVTGIKKLTCALTPPTIPNQTWDYGQQLVTSSYAFPDFSTSVCTDATFTYSAAYSPGVGTQITFP